MNKKRKYAYTIFLFMIINTCYGYQYFFDNQTPFSFAINIKLESGKNIRSTIRARQKITLSDTTKICATSIVITSAQLSSRSFIPYNGQMVSTSNIKYIGDPSDTIELAPLNKTHCGNLAININTTTEKFHITPPFGIYYNASFELSIQKNP